MSEEITSLKALEYFEGQCFAYFEMPQTHSKEEERMQGVFSYQKDKISFSFMIESFGKSNQLPFLYAQPKYKTIYILTNKQTYTIYKPYSQNTSGYSLGHPAQITLHYEWLFNDWIDPETIKGEHFICRTNYLESFIMKNRHLLYEIDNHKHECEHRGKNEKQNECGDEDFVKQSFWIQKRFSSKDFKNDKIKAKPFYTLSAPEQHRFFSCQYDLYLECNIVFEDLDRLALTAEAIKNFFVLIYAYSDFDIQIDHICIKPKDKQKYVTALRKTYAKDKELKRIDPYGIAIRFWEIDNFSAVLEKWIDFYIQNKDFQYVSNILEIINKKEQAFHLYSDLFFMICMVENLIEQQQIAKIDKVEQSQQIDKINEALHILADNNFPNEVLQKYKESLEYGIVDARLGQKLTKFFKISLSNTKCDQTKQYFNSKCRKRLCKHIVEYRNALAHGRDLKLNKQKIIKIAEVYTDFKQIIIEYFFGAIGLNQYINKNIGFVSDLNRRNYISTQKQGGKSNE